MLDAEPLPAYEPDAAGGVAERLDADEEVYAALVLGLRDYVAQERLPVACVLGLSGGIDSALVAAIACDALGAEHVHGVSMPSAYSSDHSIADAEELARRTGLHCRIDPDRADGRRLRATRWSSPGSPRRTCRRGCAARS